MSIEMRDVHKAFGPRVILNGVTLAVRDGETLAVIGYSGVGKSVLLKSIIRLLEPDSGTVTVDGEVVAELKREQLYDLRRRVGYVFQFAALFDSMTVFENVSQGIPESDLKAMRFREALRRVADALEHVNLDPRLVLSKLPAELSGGMRKRVGLARAIVGRPEILLYDEPVTGLDPVNAAIVHQLIQRLADELGVTSIIVTHDIEGALPISDRVSMLDKGRIRFVGTPQQFRESDDALVRAFLERDAMIDSTNMLEAV
jgi:phospholipid/cholesterol/gamma-HCH transport system ATP-binding protein